MKSKFFMLIPLCLNSIIHYVNFFLFWMRLPDLFSYPKHQFYFYLYFETFFLIIFYEFLDHFQLYLLLELSNYFIYWKLTMHLFLYLFYCQNYFFHWKYCHCSGKNIFKREAIELNFHLTIHFINFKIKVILLLVCLHN